ncbi:MAG TPA: winged helix-turn-helix domain-containing protein [Planctomycetota bacterium]|nr:winged helix-turn-helix domain-containing protein [Planctomycetota bacterium]
MVDDPANKHAALVAILRRRVRSGQYAAGTRMPTVRDLAAEFGASVPTVSRCLVVLADQGFIVTDGRRGTRVVDHPPHRCRFGLVLPEAPDPDGRYASLHWQALADAARALARDPRRQIEAFHAVSEHPELIEHQRLLAAIRDGAIAGMVVCEPRRLHQWLDVGRVRLPMVGAGLRHDRPERGQIRLDPAVLMQQALDRVHAAGRRRLAVLMDATPWSFASVPWLRSAAAARSIDLPEHRVQAAPLGAPAWARHAVEAMMRAEGPDALIVADDNLLADAEAGLDAAGVAAEAVLVVAHANYPLASPTRRPAIRLGWDMREFLARATDAIAAWNERRTPVGDQELPVRDSASVAPA